MNDEPTGGAASTDPLRRLEHDLRRAIGDPRLHPRTARLQAAGAPQQAKKLVEEAAELAIEAVRGNRDAALLEAADLVYHLAVLLGGVGITVDDLGDELERRRRSQGIAAKLPKRTGQ
jgi:phosphoribosyl-ATP pyrophosphohydrolase